MQVGNVPRVHGKMHGKVSKGAIAGKTGNNYDGPKRRKANNFRVLLSQHILRNAGVVGSTPTAGSGWMLDAGFREGNPFSASNIGHLSRSGV